MLDVAFSENFYKSKKGFFPKNEIFGLIFTLLLSSSVMYFLNELYDFKGLEYFSFNWNRSEIKNWSVSVNGHSILKIVEQILGITLLSEWNIHSLAIYYTSVRYII